MPHALNHGLLVAIEGIDGAGKTTQVAALADALRAVGLTVTTSKEPTSGPWGQKIRESATSGRMSLDDELAAFLEDRREHVRDLIQPALQRGEVVIVDRYYYSTAAYQGARGADPAAIVDENRAFAPRPHVLAIIDVPADVGLQRVEGRDGEGNEFEQLDALAESRRLFRENADEWGATVINGVGTPAEITAALVQRVAECAADHLHPRDMWTASGPLSGAAKAVGALLGRS